MTLYEITSFSPGSSVYPFHLFYAHMPYSPSSGTQEERLQSISLHPTLSNASFKMGPCLYNLYAEYIMWNSGLDEAQAGVKIPGRNIDNLRYADDTPLWQKAKKN